MDYNGGASSASQSTRLGSAEATSTRSQTGGAAGFDSFKQKLRSNLQGVKKQTKTQNQEDEEGNGMAPFNSAKLTGFACHNYTEDVRRIDLCPGFI